jgi:hypothetical protein
VDAVKGGTHLNPTGEPALRGVVAAGGPNDLGGELSLTDVHDLVRRLAAGGA